MICPRCGREVPDGAVCPCSASAPQMTGKPILSSNPAVNIIKTMGSSGQFLTAAICLTAGLLFYLLFAFQIGDFISTTSMQTFNSSGFNNIDPGFSHDGMKKLSGFVTVVLLVWAAPVILSLFGFWLHYGACRSDKSGNVSTAGLTVWKVMLYIRFIGVCVFGGAFVLISILGIAAGGFMAFGNAAWVDSADAQAAGGALIAVYVVLFVVFAAFLSLAVIYYVCMIRIVNRAKAAAFSGVPDNRVSLYPIVLKYIAAGYIGLYSLLWLLTSVMAQVAVAAAGEADIDLNFGFLIFLGVAMLAYSVCTIFVNLCLNKYRKQMTALIYPPIYAQFVPPVQGYQSYTGQPVMPAAPLPLDQPIAPAQPEAPAEQAPEMGQKEKTEK